MNSKQAIAGSQVIDSLDTNRHDDHRYISSPLLPHDLHDTPTADMYKYIYGHVCVGGVMCVWMLFVHGIA